MATGKVWSSYRIVLDWTAFAPNISLIACRLHQLDPEAANRKREQGETGGGGNHAYQQRRPKAQSWQQGWKSKEHGQGRNDIPEGVPRVIRQFGFRLLFHMQPDKREHGNQWQ